MTSPPVVLTIAGSDCSGGAGIQADLKAITAAGAYALTAVTCVVAELPGRVLAVHPVPPDSLRSQIDVLFEGIPIVAVKTGMLFSRELIRVVCESLTAWKSRVAKPFHLVVDPVMVATSGDSLLEPDAVEAYIQDLIPLADLVTPNVDEAEVLAGVEILDLDALEACGRALTCRFGTAFLMKGGHIRSAEATDFLVTPEGTRTFKTPFVKDIETHGTGCTYSSAIAARLAMGSPLEEAVAEAKKYLTAAIANSFRWNAGSGRITALNHTAS